MNLWNLLIYLFISPKLPVKNFFSLFGNARLRVCLFFAYGLYIFRALCAFLYLSISDTQLAGCNLRKPHARKLWPQRTKATFRPCRMHPRKQTAQRNVDIECFQTLSRRKISSFLETHSERESKNYRNSSIIIIYRWIIEYDRWTSPLWIPFMVYTIGKEKVSNREYKYGSAALWKRIDIGRDSV